MDNVFSDTPLHGAIAWITLIYILFVAALPWTAGPGSGARAVLVRTVGALLGLAMLSSATMLQCAVGYCGHGAIVLPALIGLAGFAGAVTLVSGGIAWLRWR
jgi:hypothetical protein